MKPFRFRDRRPSLSALFAALAITVGLSGIVSAEEAPPTQSQTLVKVDDFAVTDLHFALFASQTGRNPSDPEGQIRLLNELVSQFMIANSPEGRALAKSPEVTAAIEVARARLIAQAFVRSEIAATPIDDAELRALYDERYGESSGKEYKARHILLEDEDSARSVIAELESGADFAELARERSTGPSKTAGGDLGWFEPGQMVEPFATATAQLADGSYTKTPVQTQFGWHVILREASRDAAPPAFDAVKDELSLELQQQRVADVVARIRDNTRIEIQSAEGPANEP